MGNHRDKIVGVPDLFLAKSIKQVNPFSIARRGR